MAVVEKKKKNPAKALIYRKEYDRWKDSTNNQNKVWAVADYEKKYAVAQKQKQIKVLEVENELKETQRKTSFYSAMTLLLLLIAGVYFYAKNVRNAKIILFQKNKLNELNTTKDQLFSIVSHDLRSSVNALKTSNTKLTASLEIITNSTNSCKPIVPLQTALTVYSIIYCIGRCYKPNNCIFIKNRCI